MHEEFMRISDSYCQHSYQCRLGHITRSYQWASNPADSLKCSDSHCTLHSLLIGRGNTLNSAAPPTFYFEDPKSGHIYTPSGPLGPKVTKKLSSQGYLLREITSDRDYAKFKRQFSAQLTQEHDEAVAAQIQFDKLVFGPAREEGRRRLREQMESMSSEGREFAAAAMREGDRADFEKYQQLTRPYDPQTHIESRELDSQSRQPWNDPSRGIGDHY